ncbi:MAG: Ppx/GppA family phosphatase [Sedimentisphaerales bacterium]|nr:Ppx/GppA family phosphatase [Sedimentisphaerales bacterium]
MDTPTQSNNHRQKAIEAPQMIGAIDIGSNSIRLVIAQILPDEKIEVLERLQRAVKLGQDTFRAGRISRPTMSAAIGILRDYKNLLDLYNVEQVAAVATSAVREAGNSDAFLDRIYMTTGLDVMIIGTAEENRLTVSAVHQALKQIPKLAKKRTIIVHVGGGGTLLTLWHKGEILASQSLTLGSLRLQENFASSGESPAQMAELLRHQITTNLSTGTGSFDLKGVQNFVAVGGDARFAADQIGKPINHTGMKTITAKDFDKLVKQCQVQSTTDLVRRYELPFQDAETLTPALILYQVLMRQVHAEEMVVSYASMRDGLILELSRTVAGKPDEILSKGVIHAAMALAERYDVDMKHALHVAGLAAKLFDELQNEHGMNTRQCLLLQVATLLHEVGGYISNRAHHKHSYYIINNSEVFGLSSNDLTIIAHTARYHRRSRPKTSHIEYMALPRETRLIINKLAAILRVAEALDVNRAQTIDDFQCEITAESLKIITKDAGDLTLERRTLAERSDMFEDIFGMKIHLE